MFLSILIPTYNRVDYVSKNLKQLESMIVELGLVDEVDIVVSNNCSSDSTRNVIEALVSASKVSIDLVHQAKNIGSVRNVLYLLEYSTSEYVMFLGDDDYICQAYLLDVISTLKNNSVGLIVPSNLGVTEAGEQTGFSRDTDLVEGFASPGFAACLEYSWRGHQMSGLVFRRCGLNAACKTNGIDNMYLFVFLVAFSSLRDGVKHATLNPVLVTQPPQKVKGWSYGDDGLIADFFENFRRLSGISIWQRSRLELRVLDVQYWRYMMYLKLGPGRFFRALLLIFYGGSTSVVTRCVWPFVVPFFILKRILILLWRGSLFKTLSRTVDI